MGEYNQKVYAFARRKVGERVGRGECWDLPHEALVGAGAESSDTTRANADYKWGDAVPLEEVTPGDVLQFRDHVVMTTVVTRTTFKDGSWSEKTQERKQTRGHHSAIVASGGQTSIEIFEQNVKPKGKLVQLHTLVIKGSGPTEKKTESPGMKDTRGKLQPATIVETTTVVVSGVVSAYRPRAKQP